MLVVKARYRCELVQNLTMLGPIRCACDPAIAATNSSRAVMLIHLITNPADENRSGANRMRQRVSFRCVSS
jgi:hypothetical protein